MPEPTVAELVEALKIERPKPPEGETAVFCLPDGTELLVKHWPGQGWEAAVKVGGRWSVPLELIRSEMGT